MLKFFIVYLKCKFNWVSCNSSVNFIVGIFEKPDTLASEVVLWRGSVWRLYGNRYQLCGYTTKCVVVSQGVLLANRVSGQVEGLDMEQQEQARITWDLPGTSVPRMMTSHLPSELHRDLSWPHREGGSGKGSLWC